MSTNLETALDAWESSTSATSEEEANGRARAYTFLIRQIAAGKSLSSDDFAGGFGIAPEAASDVFSGLQASGMEFDQEGNLVGAALTPRPTPHRITFDGKELFAWCALDTPFIPGLLDQVAQVKSLCAATREEIRLRVGPRGVEACEPAEAAISVVPSWHRVRSRRNRTRKPDVNQMHFFRSREDAESWAETRTGVVVLSVQDGAELAQRHWVGPSRRAHEG